MPSVDIDLDRRLRLYENEMKDMNTKIRNPPPPPLPAAPDSRFDDLSKKFEAARNDVERLGTHNQMGFDTIHRHLQELVSRAPTRDDLFRQEEEALRRQQNSRERIVKQSEEDVKNAPPESSSSSVVALPIPAPLPIPPKPDEEQQTYIDTGITWEGVKILTTSNGRLKFMKTEAGKVTEGYLSTFAVSGTRLIKLKDLYADLDRKKIAYVKIVRRIQP